MHEEHHVSPISCSNAHAKSKKKTTATNAEDKKIKKRLRDPEVVENMEKPLEEALVYLNHLLKIGEHCDIFKNCPTSFTFGTFSPFTYAPIPKTFLTERLDTRQYTVKIKKVPQPGCHLPNFPWTE
jgi:hypothetical protein